MFKCRKKLISVSTLRGKKQNESKKYRSSRQMVFCEKGVLKNLARFTGEQLRFLTELQIVCKIFRNF